MLTDCSVKVLYGTIGGCKGITSSLGEKNSTNYASIMLNASDTFYAHHYVTTIFCEERKKEKCQLNLTVHQLAESTKEDPQSRKTNDISTSSKLI